MKTVMPPRLSAKKVKKAPHNAAINQYSLVRIVFNVPRFIRDIVHTNLSSHRYLNPDRLLVTSQWVCQNQNQQLIREIQFKARR